MRLFKGLPFELVQPYILGTNLKINNEIPWVNITIFIQTTGSYRYGALDGDSGFNGRTLSHPEKLLSGFENVNKHIS